MAGFPFESCGKRQHGEATPEEAMQERIKRLRIASDGSPYMSAPSPLHSPQTTPHPGLARQWAVAQQQLATAQQQHQVAWQQQQGLQQQPQHLAMQYSYGALGHSGFAHPAAVPHGFGAPPMGQMGDGGAPSDYGHMNSLLRQLHAERVHAGARRQWVEEDDDDAFL